MLCLTGSFFPSKDAFFAFGAMKPNKIKEDKPLAQFRFISGLRSNFAFRCFQFSHSKIFNSKMSFTFPLSCTNDYNCQFLPSKTLGNFVSYFVSYFWDNQKRIIQFSSSEASYIYSSFLMQKVLFLTKQGDHAGRQFCGKVFWFPSKLIHKVMYWKRYIYIYNQHEH